MADASTASHGPFSIRHDAAPPRDGRRIAQAGGMLLALGLAAGMGIPGGADVAAPLTNMHGKNNNRCRLPRRRRPRGEGARPHRPAETTFADSSGVFPCHHQSTSRSDVELLFPPSLRRPRSAAALARSRRLQRPGRCAGRPAAGAAGERRSGGAAHRRRQRGVQRPARSHRVRRAAAARLRHDRQDPLQSTAPWCRRASCCSRSTRGRSRPRRRGRSRSSPPTQGSRRAGAERARAGQDPARFAGDLAPGVRPADLRHAHLAGRHPGRRGDAAHGPAQPRVHPGARADRRPRFARQHHRRQPGQRAVGADLDRRREQGLRLFRRQRADLPAAARRREGAAIARRR